ncbi:MAG TPA: phosphopantetheine-binding protein [Acidimicrobiales bacterium]
MTPAAAHALLARLLAGVAPEVDLDAVDPTASFTEEARLDSLDFLNLMNALRDEAGIDVPERDYPLLQTVEGFVDYVASHGVGGA